MPFVTPKSLLTLTLLAIAGPLIVGGYIWSGIYNVGADDPHTRPAHALLQTMRQRSIARRANSIEVPDLSDPALIRQGAGNYDSMCVGCHLAPGMEDTELSKGLYPAPPALAKAAVGNAAHNFWVIKHGIKATGMPAWGKSMEDPYIWGMVAFVQQLLTLDADEYQALVASSGGHSHGGAETETHEHAAGTTGEHDTGMSAGETADDGHQH
jgi:mono/diheme cytochrome c family protein